MTNLHKIIGFLLIFNLITLCCSDHHQGTHTEVDKPLSLEEFQKLVQQGFPIIDLRHLPQNGIIKGSYWVSENGNVGQMTSFVISPEEKYVVVTEEPKKIQNLKKLVSSGFKNILGYNAFDMKEWRENLINSSVKSFEELDKRINQAFIDVRTRPQLVQTGMFSGALWIPIQQFSKRLDEVEEFMNKNKDSQIVVHCKMSPRARLAASIMAGKGLGPVTVLDENIERIRHKFVPFNQEL